MMPTTSTCRMVPTIMSSGSGSPSTRAASSALVASSAGIERPRLAIGHDRARHLVELQARSPAWPPCRSTARRCCSGVPTSASTAACSARQVHPRVEHADRHARRELLADVAATLRRHRRQQLDADLRGSPVRSARPLRRQQRRQRAAIGRVLGRIEMQRRPAAGERHLRHDVLLRGDVQVAVGGGARHVRVTSSAPRIRPRHRCARPGIRAAAGRTRHAGCRSPRARADRSPGSSPGSIGQVCKRLQDFRFVPR